MVNFSFFLYKVILLSPSNRKVSIQQLNKENKTNVTKLSIIVKILDDYNNIINFKSCFFFNDE